MIECILTVDYEVYGNGDGSLRSHVYEPMERLMRVLDMAHATCVVFVEVAELDRMEQERSDPGIGEVRGQIRRLHARGCEIGLHLHPQWYNAKYSGGRWHLDYSEYNLCVLGKRRIAEIADKALKYLRGILESRDFVPTSFRAGNWLFQPTADAAEVLADRGVRVDSSVFKGGLQRGHHLDYRAAMGNGCYWRFSRDVVSVDASGRLIEIPIYTRMVPFWRMATAKRMRLQRHGGGGAGAADPCPRSRLDRLRWRYPLKLDYCRMTAREFAGTMDAVRRRDEVDTTAYRPIVAIGHTKDFEDEGATATMLEYLRRHGIATSMLSASIARCQGPEGPPA